MTQYTLSTAKVSNRNNNWTLSEVLVWSTVHTTMTWPSQHALPCASSTAHTLSDLVCQDPDGILPAVDSVTRKGERFWPGEGREKEKRRRTHYPFSTTKKIHRSYPRCQQIRLNDLFWKIAHTKENFSFLDRASTYLEYGSFVQRGCWSENMVGAVSRSVVDPPSSVWPQLQGPWRSHNSSCGLSRQATMIAVSLVWRESVIAAYEKALLR